MNSLSYINKLITLFIGIFNKYKSYFRLISYLIILLIFLSISYKIYADWDLIEWDDIQFEYSFLFLSFILLISSNVFQSYVWKKVLSMFNVSINFNSCFRIEMISQIGKYIPGKIGLVFTKFIECSKIGIPKKISLVSAFYQIGMGLYFQLLVGIAAIPFMFQTIKDNNISFSVITLLFFIPFGLLFIHPKFFIFFINILLKFTNKEIMEIPLGIKNWISVLLLFLLLTILNGCIGFVMINIFYPVPFNKILYIVGVNSWAFMLGLLNVFAPSGIGVRDGILIGLYSYIMPAPIALAVTIMIRLVGTTTEWLLIGIAFWIKPTKIDNQEL